LTVPCKPEPESRGHNSPHNLTNESAVRCLREFIEVQENWLIVLALGLDGAKYLIRGHEAVITHRFIAKSLTQTVHSLRANSTDTLCTITALYTFDHPTKRHPPRLATRPELAVQRIGPGVLASGEPVHASIGAVIHPVVDGVNTAAGASVLANGAAGSGGSLGRGVADLVTGTGAAALEDVVEAEPVADLVGGGGTLVVGGGSAAGQGVGQVDAAVEGEVGGGRAGGGEVAPAEGG
jgi:hypothetical protein